MRYFFAILSLVIATVLIVLGIGQRTFLAGPNSVKYEISAPADDSLYMVIPAEAFDVANGNPSLVIQGERVFAALAEERDALGWASGFAHEQVQAELNSETLVSTPVAAIPGLTNLESDNADDEASQESAIRTIDPSGSDLWLTEYTSETTLKVSVAMKPSQALIITSQEGTVLPDSVYLTWAQERSTPLAGPLLATGALFAALGAILYLFAVDHDRRGLGPRRGRRGPLQGLRNPRVNNPTASKRPATKARSRRGARLGFSVATGLALTVGLSACSPSYWPSFEEPAVQEPEEEQRDTNAAVVPVTNAQVDRILDRVLDVATEGDANLDASVLDQRFTGTALTQRTFNYLIREAQPDWRVLPHLTDVRVNYDLVQSTEQWPRTMFITVESSGQLPSDEEPEQEPESRLLEDADAQADEDAALESEDGDTAEGDATEGDETPEEPAEHANPETTHTPTLALLLTQASPYENYQLSHVIELRGGIEMPAAAPSAEGTAILANDIRTLKLSPRDLASTFASMLESGENEANAELFDVADDYLLQRMGQAWAADHCAEQLLCSTEVSTSDEPIVTLSTGQGGVLVLLTLNDHHVMEVEGERNVVALTSVEEALGLSGTNRLVKRFWQHDILFYVPNADADDQITILGSSSEIIGATSD